jgi:L-iditol 2-dehydrogenase
MQALMKQKPGPGHLELADAAVPEPGPGEVQIAIRAAGICGTDIHIVHDSFPHNPPVILGHEFCGDVSAVGSGVPGLEVGDRVMAETTAVLCGECFFCRNGHTNRCPKRVAYGIHVNGGFAEYVVVRKDAVHALPPNVDYYAGALTEPLAVCVHALMERTRVESGQLLLVLGPGPIGLFATLVAKSQGATVVVAGTAKDSERLELWSISSACRPIPAERTSPSKPPAPLHRFRRPTDAPEKAAASFSLAFLRVRSAWITRRFLSGNLM